MTFSHDGESPCCTSSERHQSEACPGLTGPPTVGTRCACGGQIPCLRHVFYTVRVDHGSILSLLGGPERRRDFIPER